MPDIESLQRQFTLLEASLKEKLISTDKAFNARLDSLDSELKIAFDKISVAMEYYSKKLDNADDCEPKIII
tara:strand:+ start:4144 stop:4356 length:213 start_codon:yes stop_codon:yes gene_type:complete